jgi:TrmH family RNA methyltransferase
MKQIEKISSLANSKIKELGKLALKKYRLESNSFMVENFTIIKDALLSAYQPESLFITEDFIQKYPDKISSLEEGVNLDYYLIDNKINKAYSQLDTPSGITAVYSINTQRELTPGPVVYLNGVSDPGNLGAILRSALAFGFKNIVLDAQCVDLYNSKVISAAKDAIFKLNIISDEDGSWLKNNKTPLYITSSHGGINLSDFKTEENYCLVLGGESHGVSEEIIKRADKKIKIEMSEEIESLNVAIATALLLYKFRRLD